MAFTTVSTGFPGIVKAIYENAYVMDYEGVLLDKLCKPIGVGETGHSVVFPYLDPTAFVTGTSHNHIFTETADFSDWNPVTSASVICVGSDFIEGVKLTDKTIESMKFDIADEVSRRLMLTLNAVKENHIYGLCVSKFATGTLTQASATLGLQLTELAKGMATLDSRKLKVPGPYDYVTNGLGWYYTALSTISNTYKSAFPNVGDKVLDNWYMGQFFGKVNCYVDNYVTSSSTAVTSMFAHKAAIGFWNPRTLQVKTQRDESYGGGSMEFIGTSRLGAKIIAPSYGIRIVANTA
jgi:hypothetical protein